MKIDAARYGHIPGVTDREYYTNSFHVPVYYPISAFRKIQLEAPYHALTNAGHISYVELDGDPLRTWRPLKRLSVTWANAAVAMAPSIIRLTETRVRL